MWSSDLMKVNLGSALLWTTSDNQLMKEKNDVVEIKFHSNENIQWHRMQLELN
jgi:hypothetical protein